MQGCQGRVPGPGKHREVHEVGMEVEDVELAGLPLDLFKHHDVEGDVVADIWVKPQRLAAHWDQVCPCSGTPAGKQGDLVSLPDELICQIGDHTFGASVKTGRHAFDEGSNLRDLHG